MSNRKVIREVWRMNDGQGGLGRHNGISSSSLLEEGKQLVVG